MRKDIQDMSIGVIMGGISPEKDVCRIEGEEIYNILYEHDINVVKIILDNELTTCYRSLAKKKLDFAFLALTEDIPIQDVLDMFGIPYSGSDRLTTTLSMDKVLVKQLVQSWGMKTPKCVYLRPDMERDAFVNSITKQLNFPIVLKPADLGTSVGVSFIQKKQRIKQCVDSCLSYSRYLLAEEFIDGTEVTIPMMGDNFWGIVEIHPTQRKTYDYRAKMDNFRKQIYPSTLPQRVQKQIKSQTEKIYELLGCKGLVRIDGIVRNSTLYFLEVNTLPFMVGSCAPAYIAKNRFGMSKFEFLVEILKNNMITS